MACLQKVFHDWKANTKKLSARVKAELQFEQQLSELYRKLEIYTAAVRLVVSLAQAVVLSAAMIGKTGVRVLATGITKVLSYAGKKVSKLGVARVLRSLDKVTDAADQAMAVFELVLVRLPMLVFCVYQVCMAYAKAGYDILGIYDREGDR